MKKISNRGRNTFGTWLRRSSNLQTVIFVSRCDEFLFRFLPSLKYLLYSSWNFVNLFSSFLLKTFRRLIYFLLFSLKLLDDFSWAILFKIRFFHSSNIMLFFSNFSFF